MMRSMKCMVAGTLAVAGVAIAAVDAQAMPVQPLTSTAGPASTVEHIWWRGGWRRGWGWRGYGYGWRRPLYGYGWRRPFYGYGWRRPFYGYGYRRW